ncbi:MAG: right-handed parallel beta-helix repeat-containing protein [Chitinophagaceae bacterium]|nr:MAG: right-handed parallel beta-helix repeat-containing protein [Chitinophagaceae bacterium]
MNASRLVILLLLSLGSNIYGQQDLARVIDSALKTGNPTIVLPKQDYVLKLENLKPLLLRDLHNILIDGGGSTVTCLRPTQAVQISNCTNLKFANFSFDYDPLPFIQGFVTMLDTAEGMWMEVEIEPSFDIRGIENNLPDRLQIFNPVTLELRSNLFTYWRQDFTRIEHTSGRRFRVYNVQSHLGHNISPGDRIVFSIDSPGPSRPHAIVLDSCSSVLLQDVTVYASNCFGFFEQEGTANRYFRCRVTKRTYDPISLPVRLRSTNADAFHSKAAIRGPVIEECTFQYQGDDGVAINSSFYEVISANKFSVDVIGRYGYPKMRIADKVQFVDSAGKRSGSSILMGITEIVGKAETGTSDHLRTELPAESRGMRIFRLVLADQLSLPPGVLVSSLDMAGAGFRVVNNTIGFTRARGILVKASGGVISGNKIEGCELAAIVVAPEFGWMEAGLSENVHIINNSIKNCMFANSAYGIEQAAPISVVVLNRFGQFSAAGSLRNIFIKNNKITDSPWPAIMVTSVYHGSVTGNVIGRPGVFSRTHGQNFGVINSKAIWTRHTKLVSMQPL